MTQLFDISTYDDTDPPVATETTAAAPAERPGRHLRSVTLDGDLVDRQVDWRLDSDTIEIGRRGIARAREALREAAKGRPAGRRAA